MLPTESLGWNGLQALKSRLSGRLERFTRDKTPSSRPQKLQNDAAFFEVDLRHIFTITPTVYDISQDDYYYMDEVAQNLLASLNEMVNKDIIEHSDESIGQEIRSFRSVPSRCPRTDAHDITVLGDTYPQLSALLAFLDNSTDHFNLATGPGSLLFELPQGQAGVIAMDHVITWKTFLEKLASSTQESQVFQHISPQQEEFLSPESTQNQLGLRQKRASIVVDAIFKEFRKYDCGKTHEIKLKVSDDWQTSPYQTALNMFVSCCPDGSVWQEAKCGSFQYVYTTTLDLLAFLLTDD
ncbi:uncharacterized protein N7503_000335 [Penicillium pulvis]|uniref:uncharacterized protein n=1 Tax=Penicillium pulvis TaxID=1562058 RepID=UPI002548A5DD|nr:uncharacterized protein N7503_000335 [Penicillium pulvis]KAJ5813585.1 hypothetical protein N7503_000335 [Penicillium pulvis]